MPSGQDYASRLREETHKTLATHIRELEEGLRSFQERFSASLAPITHQLGSILDMEMPATEAILSEAVAEATRESDRRRSEDMLNLARFAHNMRRMETQDEILNTLLDQAHLYAPRLALFITRGNQFRGWSSRGFEPDSAQKLGQCNLVLSECPLLRRALEANGLTTANDLATEPALLELFGKSVEGPLHAFPMKAIGRPVAILLASADAGRTCDLESLCILMDLTGLCVENLALKILHEMKMAKSAAPAPAAQHTVPQPAATPAPAAQHVHPQPAVAPAPAAVVSMPESAQAAAPTPAPAEIAGPVAEPSEVAPEAVAEVTPYVQDVASTEAGPPAATAPADIDRAPVEPTEALPAQVEPEVEEEVADSLPHPEVPAVSESEEAQELVRTSVLREVQPLSEEEKLHADAKRFARLLASEIKLYNEQRVQEGRSNRDIYVRLKRDIDRSRDMYEKRVSPVVSRKVDYFHDEIIRVLGDNDPSTLGSDYPGPRVES